MIGLGVLVSIPALLVAYLYALYIGKRVTAPEEIGTEDADELEAAYDALRRSYGRMPGTAASFAPIIAPHPAHGSRLARIRPEVDRPRG